MTALAVIPARFASSRFPGKPLVKDTGKYLIQHVYESVRACDRLDRVIVATDDERIIQAVKSFGGEVAMTASHHPSGTSRVAEVAASRGLSSDDLVLNVQGDEPEIRPEVLSRLIDRMNAPGESSRIATLAAPFADDGPSDGPGSPLDPNCVKVVVDARGHALYFSRSLIPYPRSTAGVVDRPSRWLLHLGVYAFRADALQRITAATCKGPKTPEPGTAASVESLEQLDWVRQGITIAVVLIDHGFVGIDTRKDYAAFVSRHSKDVKMAPYKENLA